MKNVHHPRGKRLLAMLVSLIATSAILSSTSAIALSPPNIHTDMAWRSTVNTNNPSKPFNGIGYNGVTDIAAAFNYARRNEEVQLNLADGTLGTLTLPSQTVWNGMSDDAKALYLINAERTARAGMQSGVIGLPLAGIEAKIDTVAQNYANLLRNNNQWSHNAPSLNSSTDNPGKRIDAVVGSSCKEFTTRSENLAAFRSMSDSSPQTAANIPLPVERAIYNWIYDDASSSWGHREAVLLQNSPLSNPAATTSGFKNNHGSSSHEGFLGFHVTGSTEYTYAQTNQHTYNYGVIVVMNMFDPVIDANAGSCGYNVTLRTEDLPTPGVTNQPPVAVNDSATTTPGTAVTITNVLSNDSDLDGDALTVTGNGTPTNGTVIRSGNNFTYTPNAGVSNTTGSFTYTISDGKGGTATATVIITIGAAPPSGLSAVDDNVTTEFGKAITFNVLANDTPKTGVSVAVGRKPSKGSVSINRTTGVAKYTPKKGAEGSDSFTYSITNTARQTATATVNVTITPLVKPVTQNDTASTKFNTPVTVNVLANDTGTGLSLVSATRPTKGTVKVDKTKGSVTYTPNRGTSGSDSFDYTVKNTAGGTATAKVAVNVAANTAPTASFFAYDVGIGRARTLDKMSQHTQDVDGDAILANTVITRPTKGTVSIRSGKFVYTPRRGQTGDDFFSYTVKDIHGAVSNTGNIRINITATPHTSS